MTLRSFSVPASTTSQLQRSLDSTTNTIIIASIPRAFFHLVALDILKKYFMAFGEINRWVPLPGFGRIIVVYEMDESAEEAKIQCDPIILSGFHDRSEVVLRVYRADRSPLLRHGDEPIPSDALLRPPALEKNFLISPPGSPPVGWEQAREDPPNSAPLADDLMQALRRLQLRERRPSMEVLLDPQEGSGVGVYVEDCDGEVEADVNEEEWVYGETMSSRLRWQRTALPPMPRSLTV